MNTEAPTPRPSTAPEAGPDSPTSLSAPARMDSTPPIAANVSLTPEQSSSDEEEPEYHPTRNPGQLICCVCEGVTRRSVAKGTVCCHICYTGLWRDSSRVAPALLQAHPELTDLDVLLDYAQYSSQILEFFDIELNNVGRPCSSGNNCTKMGYHHTLLKDHRCTRCRTRATIKLMPDVATRLLQKALGCAQQQTIGQRAHLHRASAIASSEQAAVDLPARPARERRDSNTHTSSLTETAKAYDALGRPVPMRKLRLRHAVKAVNPPSRALSPSPSPPRLRHSPRAEPSAHCAARVHGASSLAQAPPAALPSFESMASPAKSAAAAHALTCLANAGRSRPLFSQPAQMASANASNADGIPSTHPPAGSGTKSAGAHNPMPYAPLEPVAGAGLQGRPLKSELEALIHAPSHSADQASKNPALPSLDEIFSSQYGAMAQMLLAAGVAMGMGMRNMWPSSPTISLQAGTKCGLGTQSESPAPPPHAASAWPPRPGIPQAQPPSEPLNPAHCPGPESPAASLVSMHGIACVPSSAASGWATPASSTGPHVEQGPTPTPLASPSPPEQACAGSLSSRRVDGRATPLFAVPKGPSGRHQPHQHTDLRAACASLGSPVVSNIRPGLSMWHQASPSGTPPSVAYIPRSDETLPRAHARNNHRDAHSTHNAGTPALSSRHSLFGQQPPAEKARE